MIEPKLKAALFMTPLLTSGGGAEKYFINLSSYLARQGYPTDIITLDDNYNYNLLYLYHVQHLNFAFPKRQPILPGKETIQSVIRKLGKAHWIKTSWKNLRKTLNTYDVIYAKNEIIDLVLLKLIGYDHLPPVVVGIHTPVYYPVSNSFWPKIHNFLYMGFFYHWLLDGVSSIHVSNSSDVSLMEKQCKSKTRVKMIYYPFSTKEIGDQANNNPAPISFERKKINIAFVGRLSVDQKGIRELRRLIDRIGDNKKYRDSIALNIFGAGDEASDVIIKHLTKKYHFVHYFGYRKNRFIPSILLKQNLLISTSLWETLPYNILEAQSLGVPVIAFDIPGPKDIIIDSVTGFLAKDEDDYYRKLCVILDGRINFDKRKIIDNIQTRFSPEFIYNKLKQLLLRNVKT